MTAPPDALEEAPAARGWGPLGRAHVPLVRWVGRLPVNVRTKLLVAFAGIAVLLVVVGVLGLRVLGQSNARVARVGSLQLRAASYQGLHTQAQQLRQLLSVRVAGDTNVNAYTGGTASTAPSSASLLLLDRSIASTLFRVRQATNATQLGFVPPVQDRGALERIRQDYRRFSDAIAKIIALDGAGTPAKSQPFEVRAIRASNDVSEVTDSLASTTRRQADALVAQNRSAYTGSRNLFIGVGAGSFALALLLGFVLSLSLIGPIQRTETRLAEIAAGNFSGHVDVANRDELGVLAANVNRMNDELGRLYEQLETVSQHKSDFLANMSHELRTPLNAIIGFSEVLQQQMFGGLNEQQLGYVDDVLVAGRHLLSLINDILDLSKVEAGRMELELGDVSLPEALRSGLTMHGERAGRDGITLALHVEPDEITIRADERKLRQVVFNLLSNALKFTPPGGRVDVFARLADGVVEVAVADTGAGIAADELELIFEEFQQARGHGAGSREGTGLGLPLSRRFVELHGGRLWVESVEGAGSTFRFTLPAKRAD